MPLLAAGLLAMIAAAAPPRPFWTVVDIAAPQPRQHQVLANPVAEGHSIVAYQVESYHFLADGAAEAAAIAEILRTFDEVIFPSVVALYGAPPDGDGNGRVILLLGPQPLAAGPFFPFDLMSEGDAQRFGVHSNEGEVIYAPLDHAGNRAAWNAARLATGLAEMVHGAADPADITWRRLLGAYQPFLCGLVTPRALWGDDDAERVSISSSDPAGPSGWTLLFLEYLRGRFGEAILGDLLRSHALGISALDSLPPVHEAATDTSGLLADFALACWLDDAGIAGGRFDFTRVTPPRPTPAARALASRPSSGAVEVGVGGLIVLVVDGDGQRPFPLQMQGDPAVRWIGRAVLERLRGPDEVLDVTFNDSAAARLDLPVLAPGDSVAVAVVALPDHGPALAPRTVQLLWGVAWLPHRPVDPTAEALRGLTAQALVGGGAAAKTRLVETIDRLGGLTAAGPTTAGLTSAGPTAAMATESRGAGIPVAVTTRYAWAPAGLEVVDLLRTEAGRRGLPAEISTLPSPSDNGITQQWSNLLIRLPGSDPRRWPIVLAAHYDAARSSFEESSRRALNLDDNASGVAVALEAAAAMSRVEHRIPIVVALLAGGCHDSAGAAHLLESFGGRFTAWIELDGVGIPMAPPRGTFVRIEGEGRLPMFPWTVAQAFRHLNLQVRTQNEVESLHAGARLALHRGIASVVIRSRPVAAAAADIDLPPAVERSRLSPDLMVLVVRAVADAILRLAGVP